jgi:predicted ATP-dependent serine protease
MKKQPYILFDQYIRKYETAAIVAEAGVGKTWLSVKLAESSHVDRALYITPDDISGQQKSRYQESPAYEKMQVFSGPDLDDLLEKFQNAVKQNCEGTAIVSGILGSIFVSSRYIESRRRQLLRDFGLKNAKKIDSLLLLEIIISSPEFAQYDLVVIDSLQALLGDISKISFEVLKNIISPLQGRNRTLVILHHTNKKGDFAGKNVFRDIVDTLLVLRQGKGSIRYLSEDKARNKVERENSTLEMISREDGTVDFVLRDGETNMTEKDSDNGTMRDRILEELEEKGKISFKDLCQTLSKYGFDNPSSIKNILKQVEDAGLVRKGDGKHWDTIEFVGSV